jgi:LPXTG-motif cell wall-anchored protein
MGTGVNGDYGDNKVVFGYFGSDAYHFVRGGWDHKKQTFDEYSTNIVQPGYTAYINGQPVTSVPVQTITPDSKDIVVNVIYHATATAKLTGNGSITYNGSALTMDDLNNALHITVTGPTAGNSQLKLKSGDVAFSTNGTDWSTDLPTNVGNYQIKLTTQGEDAIKAHYGKENIILWTDEDGNSTISSDATFKIDKAKATATISGSQDSNYNGHPVTINYGNFSVSITTNNGQTITVPSGAELTAADVVITDSQGRVVTNPTKIDTYTIKLSPAGLQKFESQTDNYDWVSAGTGTLSITRNTNITVKLTGNESVVYTGRPAVIDPTQFHVTLGNGETYTLQDGDLQFVDQTTGANTNAGHSYQVELSDQGRRHIAQVDADNYGYDFTNVGTGSVTVTKATPSASMAGTAEKNYDGTPISGYLPTITITAPGNNSVTLTSGDFEWTKDGHTYTDAPSDAGTYTVSLTSAGLAKVKVVNSQNLDWSNVQVTGTGSYKIDKANATITLPSGRTETVTWNGNPATIDQSQFVPTVTSDNPNAPTITLPSTLRLTAGDYQFLQGGRVISAPSEVGTYQVQLTENGWHKVRDAIAGNANYNWTYQGEGTYNINKAAATITLNGASSTTYTGSSAVIPSAGGTVTGITVTLSNGQTYDLKPEDLEFVNAQGQKIDAPTDAGTYKVRLTSTAVGKISGLAGDHYDYTYDNGTVDFTINKATADVSLSQTQTSSYTGGAISPDAGDFAITITTNNGQTLAYHLQSGDVATAVSDPTNVGSYDVVLTDAGKDHIKGLNANYNYRFADSHGTLEITQARATATLSGQGTRVYNGSAVTVDDLNRSDANNNITLTLHYPKNGDANYSETVQLTADDFVWNTPDGNAPVNANSTAYTISLKSSIIKALLENAAGKGQDNVANVTVADSAITGSASYKITPLEATATLGNIGNYGKTYDATSTNTIDPTKLQFTTTVNGKTVVLNANGLTGSDFAWVGLTAGNYPKTVGAYSIELTDAGLTKLQADNPNFVLTKAGNGTYTISQAQGTATLSGSNEKTYNGQAITTAEINHNGQIVVNLTFPGARTNASYTLQSGDYTITPNDSADSNLTNAGTYTITLTAAGKTHVKAALEEMAGKGQDNKANATVADSAISGNATFTINPSKNYVNVSGTQTETYTGRAINVDYNILSGNSVKVNFANDTGSTGSVVSPSGMNLNSGDFQIVDASGQPTTAINAGGVYHIVLTDAGVTKIQNAVGKNYQITQGTGFGTLVIEKGSGTATFSGNSTHAYTGSAASDYLNGFLIHLTAPTDQTYNLAAGDIEFRPTGSRGSWTTEVPVNVGNYDVRLSQNAWNKIKQLDKDNITWMANAPTSLGQYVITAASATTELSGQNSMVYTGNAVTTDDLYTNGSTIKVVISGPEGVTVANLPTTYKLTDGDYTWNTSDHSAPKNQGDYTITLTDAGLNKIQAAIDHAVGEGNVALSKDNTGSATFHIAQSVVSNLQLHGNEQSTYNGQAVQIDPSNSEFKENYGFNNSEGLTIPAMSADDFEWVDAAGNTIAAPKDAGTYYLQLSKNGRDKIANANPNYTFVDNNGKSLISGRITYTINPATLVIGVSGTASKVYDGQNAAVTQDQINKGDIKLVWGDGNTSLTGEPTDLGEFTLTPDDLEVVDASGNPVVHANASANETTGNPVYYVRLKSSILNTLKGLTGAKNYDISLSNSVGNYLIYQHKAQVTLSGNQTTIYGTDLPLDATKYSVELTNWKASDGTKPDLTGKLQAGDVYIKGYVTTDKMPNGQLPKDVGIYQVMISSRLLNRLKQEFPDYDWDAVNEVPDTEKEHDPATYVIKQAEATVTINGAQHIKYSESANIQYGGTNGYTISITAPANGETKTIYTHAKFDASDLQFVNTPGDVGQYTVKLSADGLKKLAALTGSTNYDWKQATDDVTTPTATFYVDQMPVTITVKNDTKEVTYGTSDWLTAIKHNPSGYTLTVTTDGGSTLTYAVQDADLIFSQTPGSVGSYNVVLSDQGLANIKQALGTNYAYPQAASDVTTHGTFNVNQGTATVTLNGSDGKIYDGKATTSANLDPTKYSYSATVYASDGTAQTITLANDDLQFVDAHGNAITPTNAGTYTVALSPSAETRLKNLTGNNGDNYKWTFDTNATYKITASAEASAALSGSNQKVFDGSGVTTAQINNGGSIEVKFTYPGSTDSSTYQLQDGDYDWYSEDGSTKLTSVPSQKGTYTIKLTSNGLAHLQAALNALAGSGNVTLSADQLSGFAKFEITPKPISGVTISGNDQSKTYDGQAAGLDLSGLNISGTDTVSDTPLSKSGLTAGDFDWYENGIKLDGAPTKVGTYEARLTNRALTALQNNNPNYSFDAVDGTIKYTINPKAATDKLGNSGTKTYNGQGTSVSDVVNSVTWTPNSLVTGEYLDLSSLTNGDYEWLTKNADGTYTVMTGLPTNVGTYYLQLKDSGIAKIKNANTNYSFANGAISGMYTYTITAAQGSAKLAGSAYKTYDGHSVTTAEVNSTDGNIQITFTIPDGTGTTQRTYQLQDGDYTWETADGNAPTNTGTYTIKINPAKLQSIIDQIAGTGNVTISGDTGSATFKINKKDLDVTLGDKTGPAAGKTYDGHAATIDPNDGSFTANDLISGESLNTANIPASDYQWVDENGNPLTTAPTDAGTYYIALNATGLKKLQDNNPNYNISESGMFKYVISPAEADVTIRGGQESTTAEITNSNFSTSAGTGIRIPAGLTYQFANGTPRESGVYDVTLTPASLQSLKDANKNYNLKINSTAKFTLEAILTITFEDTTEGNVTVPNTTVTKTGANGNSVDLNLTIPENYELAAGQVLPTSYTFGKALNQALNIKLVHKTKTVDPTKPDTNPDPTNTDWFKQNDLTKDVTRTINYVGLNADQLSQIPDSEKSQTIHFTRTAQYDLVTGKLVPNSESAWIAKDGNDKFAGFTPHEFAGYTANLTTVPEVTVNGDDQNSTITVTYTANDQTGQIIYQDVDNKNAEVGHTDLTGKTGDTVTITPVAPSGYDIVEGQTIPATETATADGIPDVIVKVSHHQITVTPGQEPKPGDKVPGNPDKKPGDGTPKTDVSYETLHRNMTRTINVTDPHTGLHTTKVTIHYERTATIDDVNGNVTYGAWTVSDGSAKGFDAFNIPAVAGYTSEIKTGTADELAALTPTQDQITNWADQTVDIDYTANDQSMNINYVDTDGNPVDGGHFVISGKTDQTVDTNAKIPTGWVLVPGQTDAPAKITFGGTPTANITVKIQHGTTNVPHDNPVKPGDKTPTGKVIDGAHESDLNMMITRTINVIDPVSGKTTTTKQDAKLFRDATVDNVTGEVTYGAWSTASWDDFKPAAIDGYTVSQDDVAQTAVTSDTKPVMINITYTANDQSMHVKYVDDQGNVIADFPVSGKTDQTVDTHAKIPAGWVLVNGQTDAPAQITFKGAHTDDINVVIEHGKRNVNHENPDQPGTKTPTGKDVTGTQESDLNQTITRKVTIYEPGQAPQTITQTAKIYRDAMVDEVTGDVTYDPWSTDTWASVDIPVHDGYTVHQSDGKTGIPAVEVKDGQADEDITVTYTANDQTGKIVYVDVDNNNTEVGHTDLAGKTDQNITITPQIPAGYDQVTGQTIPASVKAGADGIPTVTVKVNHHKITVKPGDEPKPGDKKPGNPGKKPGDGTPKTDVSYETLHRNMTRTINVTDPHTGQHTTKVTIHYERVATIDDVTGDVTYGTWTVADGSAAGFDKFNIPAVAGYTSEIKSGTSDELAALTPSQDQITNWQDQTIDIDYTANDQSMTIDYVDKDGNPVDGGHFVVSGKTGQTVDTNARIPVGWVLVPNQTDAPRQITFTGTPTTNIKIKIEHGTQNVPHDNPVKPDGKTPTGKDINGAHEDDLNRTVTRTINVYLPDGTTQKVVQTAKIFRDATVDEVTGDVTYGAWSTDPTDWKAYTAPAIAGYTPDKSVEAVTVNENTTNTTIDIRYTASDQTGKISYVDVDDGNKEVDHTDLRGKTGEDVTITPEAPAGYDIVAGQNIPASEKATSDGIPTVTIKVSHHKITVKPDDEPKPGDKIPGNPDKKPGDGTPKTEVSYETLHRDMTRTINVIDSRTGLKTTKVTIHYERVATIDDVTGDVTYGDWTVANGSKAGFDKFDIPVVPGYTAEIKTGTADELEALTPSQDQITNWQDQVVDIDYLTNDQTMHITYVDKDGHAIAGGSFTVTGKTGQTVNTNAKIPAGWVLAPGQTDAPTTITFGSTPTTDIQITVVHGTTHVPHDNPVKPDDKTPTGKEINGAHENDLNKTITRTINVHMPDGTTQKVVQTAKIYRDATVDEVTGEVTYGEWSTDSTDWNAYTAPVVAGYTPDKSVEAVTVDENTKDTTIDINYTANDQTQVINYVDPTGKTVGTQTISGKTDETVTVTPHIPDHYTIVPGQTIPDQVTLKDKNTPITIQVTPKLDPVTDPSQLNKTISRKITINKPGEKPQVITQKATFTRTGETNEVTGKTAYTAWKLDHNGLITVDVPIVPGYTPSQSEVDGINNPTADMQLKDVTVNYTANDQATHIIYQGDGKTIKTDTVTGKTGQTVDVPADIPAGWQLVDGQSVPRTITFGPDGHADVVVTIEHATKTVTPETPADEIPNGKVPGDPSKTYEKMESLTAAPTRTITITKPDGTKQTITQTVTFTRTATFDEVTGEVTYSDWTLKSSTAKDKKADWDAYTPDAVAGYTPSLDKVNGATVTAQTPSATIDITYAANTQPTGNQPTQPSGEPTQPSGEPTQPSGEPTQPSGEPTQPSGEPTQPSGEPTQPSGEPTQPSGEPTQPSGEPTQPSGEPTQPSGEPTQPSGEPTQPSGEPTQPSGEAELNTGHIANDNSISSQLTHYANGTHKHADQLPQTGNDEHKKASALGFIFATLAGLLGIAGFKKKKKDEQ